MRRDISRLTGRTFDVLVVGGGIYGLTIACDAAQRGLEVALIEGADFGSGSSFNHLRTIHGGLRYLQTLDVSRSRESIRERRALARVAPHAVRPLPFVLPLPASLTKGAWAMRAGFLLDRIVGADRNRNVPAALYLPPGQVLSDSEAVARFPELNREGRAGAAVWYDYTAPESDRLTFAWALGAHEQGATLANYVEALELVADGQRVGGVRAVDHRGGGEIQISARVTVNATGGRVDRLLAPNGLSTRMPLLKALNLVTRRTAGETAVGGRAASGRHFFLVPWRNRALFGTWESARQDALAHADPTDAEVVSFIAELNQAFPTLRLDRDDVTLVHRGLVPAADMGNGRLSLEPHEQWRDHASTSGVEGLVSVAGAKYTTARAVAERVTDRVMRKLRRRAVSCRTAMTLLPGGDAGDADSAAAEAARACGTTLPDGTIPHLVAAYGSRYREIVTLADTRPEWRTRIADDSPVIGAELVHAVRQEMAMTLNDAVIRRTPLGALGYPGDRAATRAAAIVARESGWSDDRTGEEIAALKRFYRIR